MEFADSDIEALFRGALGTGFRPARMLVAVVDPSQRVICSTCLCDEARSRRVLPSGIGFEALFAREPLKGLALAAAKAAEAGETRRLDFEVTRGEVAVRVQAWLVPRFQAPELQRGFYLLARDTLDEDAAAARDDALRDRMAAILDHAADAIILIAEDGRIEEVNLSAESLFGWAPGELVGRPVTVLMGEPYVSTHQGGIDRYMATGLSGILNVGPRVLPARTRDGAPLSIELSVGETRIGGARKFIGVCRDVAARLRQEEALREANRALQAQVTELRRLRAEVVVEKERSDQLAQAAEAARAAAERANLGKSRLLATVSHELRTPLNGVLAVADLLAAASLSEPARELVEIIRRSGRDLMSLVNDVLDLSRVEAGAMELASEPFAPAELVDGVASVWEVAARAKGLTLSVRAEALPPWLLGDAARLRQVLANLVSNAIKYTARGGVTLAAQAAPLDEGWRLTFLVSDTGPGIEPELVDHLFEPYARGVSEASRRETGTGLGLAICRQLTDLMGGQIRAENQDGGGARFVFIVDLAAAEAPAEGRASTTEDAQALARPLKVLVAEDHEVNQRIIGLLLDQLGCEHVMVGDGVAAVEAAGEGDYDVVLMDVRMPRMDGLEAARTIRAGLGRSSAVPIIAVTADAMPAEDPEILAAGIDAVLGKPITLASLARALQSIPPRSASVPDRPAPFAGAHAKESETWPTRPISTAD
ncbi:MAG: response regulator [Proteobacteria bacterium]|nr:response regulator [Pseudomonadota bacterium]